MSFLYFFIVVFKACILILFISHPCISTFCPCSATPRPMTLCSQHLQVKIEGQRDLMCDSLCHTAVSMMRFHPPFFFSSFKLYLSYLVPGVIDISFCLAWFHSHLVPTKHTESFINYKLFVLLAQAYY